MKNIIRTMLTAAFVLFSATSAMAAPIIYSEDFSDPAKNSNAGADGYLGVGGAGFDYNGNYGTWLYAGGNMGIDDPAEGLEDGSSLGNAVSSIDHARPQDVRGGNGRAVSIILSGGQFKHGVQYTVSFDVYGDVAGNDAGFFWVAELSGYDNSGSNYVQIDGTQAGWASAKPFSAVGSATANYLIDKANIDGENVAATNTVSFTFTYDAGNSPDIGIAIGTYNNIFGIDNVEITTSGTVYEEDFTAPAKNTNAGANGYLGTGGAGFDYNGNFGTWLYNDGNMGIDNPAEGDGSGDSNNNAISSIGHARTQDERGGNARAVSVVLDGARFEDGVEYTVSFDVYGDAAGNDAGFYWLAEVYGYDTTSGNYVQIDGTQAGWASGATKPFTAAGTAGVNFLSDYVAIDGEDTDATNTVTFTFTYDSSNSPDIAFAAGTYNNIYGIDNVLISREFVDAQVGSSNVVFFGGDAAVFDGSNVTNNLFVGQTDAGHIVQWNGVDSDGGSFGASGTLDDQGIGGSLTNSANGLILTTVGITPSGSNTFSSGSPNILGITGGDNAKFNTGLGESWTFEFNKPVLLKQLVLSAMDGDAETVRVTVDGVDTNIFTRLDANMTNLQWEATANKYVYTYTEPVAVGAGTDITIDGTVGIWGLQGIVVEVVSSATGFDTFVAQYGLSGDPLADDDLDGLTDFGEYVFGGNPTNGVVDSANPVFDAASGDYVYSLIGDDSLTAVVLTTDDLVNGIWVTNGTPLNVTSTSGELEAYTNAVGTVESQKFIRLQVEFQ